MSGPVQSVVGDLATWSNVTGTALAESGVAVATVLRTDTTSSIAGNLPAYSDTNGVQVVDSGVPVGNIVRAATAATTTGQVVVADSLKAVKFLANGSDGQVLRMASGAPGWGAAPSSTIPLSVATFSGTPGSTTITLDSANNNYIAYDLIFQSLTTDQSYGTYLTMILYSNATSTLYMLYRTWVPFLTQDSGESSIIPISRKDTWATNLPIHGRLRLYVPYVGATGVSYDGMVLCEATGVDQHAQETYFGGLNGSASALYKIVFTAASGSVTAGRIHVFGLRGAS